MNKNIILLTGLALATLVVGCNPRAAEYCDLACSCRPCNDIEYDDCIIDVEEALDLADAYDCNEPADTLYDCIIERGYCDNNNWHYSNTCGPYVQIVDDCIRAHSARR